MLRVSYRNLKKVKLKFELKSEFELVNKTWNELVISDEYDIEMKSKKKSDIYKILLLWHWCTSFDKFP